VCLDYEGQTSLRSESQIDPQTFNMSESSDLRGSGMD